MKKKLLLLIVLLSLGAEFASAQCTVLHNFNDTNGAFPYYSSLVRSGNMLYGMTPNGGVNNAGIVFSIDTNGNKYKDLYDFNGTNGSNPVGSLTLSGNKLYGMTNAGGTNGFGVVFSIDTNGNKYKIISNLNDSAGNPYGSLTLSGATLYGMCNFSSWGAGSIFSIDTNGNGFKIVHVFNVQNGSNPIGDLTISGKKLYGMTSQGFFYGNVFSINTDGSGFRDLFDFNGANGNNPFGSLTLLGGKLYGMTELGANDGNIFSIDTDGTGFRDLFDFSSDGKGDGMPFGSLINLGSKLYGMAEFGEVNTQGVLFSIDTDGNDYRYLVGFNGMDGKTPLGSLIRSGNVFYGMTEYGGTDSDGVIFRYVDTLPPCENTYDQTICIVTTDTAINKNVIIWGRTNSPPSGSFNIYDSISQNTWWLIGNVPDTALSEYIDTASIPSSQSYSYRLSTFDSCGESALSPFNSTIYLQVIQRTNYDSLYWTPYVGFAVPYYLVYRGPSLKQLTLIDSVSASTLSVVDSLPPAGSIYLVKAINPSGGCVPTHSHTTHGASISTYASFSNGGVPYKPVGIGEISPNANNIKVFPNPNNGIFTIKLNIATSKLSATVYNMLGENIYSTKLQVATTAIDLSNNANGIYFYRVLTESGDLVSEGKFVIEK